MSLILDIVLVVVLLAYLAQGYRLGFVRSIGAIAGVVAGAVVAAIAAPWIASFVPDDTGRVVATIVAAIVLILLGHALGSGIGSAIGGVLRRSPLGPVDRLLGAAAGLVVSALAISVIASLAVALGVPYVAKPVAGSVVIRTIDAVTPQPVDRALAQLRSTVLGSGIPQLGIALGGQAAGDGAGGVPQAVGTAALRTASASVVKITGAAAACNREQSGSGFVVARNRVLTNAHVVAGVRAPVVLTPAGQALEARVTYFDPSSDLAVLAVPGLRPSALAIGDEPGVGDEGTVAGYPLGGPFTTGGARVVQVGQVRVPDAVGSGRSVRDIAAIRADVEPGNSGGPLLDADGAVIGVVFARSSQEDDLGYAMTPRQFDGVAGRAAGFADRVSTGGCVGEG